MATGKGLLAQDLTQPQAPLTVVDDFPADIRISAFAVSQTGNLLVGTANQGLFVDSPDNSFEQISFDDEAEPWIYSITVTTDDTVLMGTFGKGLYALDLQHLRFRRSFFDPLHPASLANDNVWALHNRLARFGMDWCQYWLADLRINR